MIVIRYVRGVFNEEVGLNKVDFFGKYWICFYWGGLIYVGFLFFFYSMFCMVMLCDFW